MRPNSTPEHQLHDRPKPRGMTLLGLLTAALLVFAVGATSTQASEETDAAAGFYTEEQLERGQEAYEQHCASCHGAQLEGGGHFPPLTGNRFWQRWEGRTVWELYEFTHDNMPLGQGGSLSKETYADIIAFQLAHYGYPEGEEELLAEEDLLEQIVLEPREQDDEDE